MEMDPCPDRGGNPDPLVVTMMTDGFDHDTVVPLPPYLEAAAFQMSGAVANAFLQEGTRPVLRAVVQSPTESAPVSEMAALFDP